MGPEKYATKAEVSYFIKLYDSDFDESKVVDTFMKMINAKIDGWIVENGKQVTNNMTDPLNLLWAAVICFAIEWFTYTKDISFTAGDLALTRLNRATYQYQRWQPMFFFATGASDSFKGLLPHESNRMMAYAFVDAYCRNDFYSTYGTPYPIPRVSFDNTSRGWHWNLDDSYRVLADDESETLSGYTDEYEEW